MNIAQAYVQLLPQTDDFTSELKSQLDSAGVEAGSSAGKAAGGSFMSGLGGAAKVGSAAVGAAAAGVMALSAGFMKMTTDAAGAGDQIDKMSQKMGISAEAYQEWDAVMQHSGTSMESLKSAMKTMSNAAEKGNEAFERLGISQDQLATMSKEDLFSSVITGLQGMEEGTERTYLASQLLGRGATELGALLNTSAEETQAMRERVHELGGVMSDEAVKSAAAFQDQLQDMQTAAGSLVRNMASEFLPSVTGVMSGLTEIFAGNMDEGVSIVGDGVKNVISQITNKLPQVIQVVGGILEALMQAIVENLPAIMETGTQLLLMLVTGIIDNLPAMVDAAIQAIAALTQGIAAALPTLIPAMVDAILTMVDALIDNMPLLIDAALQLMIGLANGLVQAIPQIIRRMPEIISSIVNAIVQSVPLIAKAGVELLSALVQSMPQILSTIGSAIGELLDNIVNWIGSGWSRMVEAGKNLILGIGEGIRNAAQSVLDSVADLGSRIVDKVKSFFGIASPSKLMEGLGEFLPLGFAEGIEAGSGNVNRAMNQMADTALMGAAEPIASSGSSVSQAGQAANAARDLTVILEIDRTQFAKTVYRLNREETQRVGVQLAGGFV